MENLVSLNVDKNMLTAAIENQVKLLMAEVLGGKDKIIDKVILETLKTKVNKSGEPSGYGNITFLEYLFENQIRDTIKEVIKEEIKERSSYIKKAIKKALQQEKNTNKLADALLEAFRSTLEDAWTSTINIDLQKIR